MPLDAEDLAGLSVRAEDPDRAREMLDDWDFRTTLAHLFAAGARDVYVQPDRIWLRTRAYQIGAAQLREWIDGLVDAGGPAPSARRMAWWSRRHARSGRHHERKWCSGL